MNALQTVKSHLEPGKVYRRQDLSKWSNAVDRHLGQLQKDNTLVKLSTGLYFYPKNTSFGNPPPRDRDLVFSFLKDNRFLILNPSVYNTLGLGTTQLYNESVVYNHKRHGRFKLGNRYFNFKVKHHFPLELSEEFLLVDLFNNLPALLEDRDLITHNFLQKLQTIDLVALEQAMNDYASVRGKKRLTTVLEKVLNNHEYKLST